MSMIINDAIAETLLIPLYMRAKHSQEKDPIISDPLAVALVRQIDYDFVKFDGKKASEIGTALRVRYFDEKCTQFLRENPNGVIVNVGCGLDTRCQRLYDRMPNLMKGVKFYSLDIDESMALRKKLIPAMNNETYVSASMFESDWLDMLASMYKDTPILFIVEGVMMYFSLDDNRRFMTAVADRFKKTKIYFDVPSVWTYKHQKHHDAVGQMRANFACGVDDVMMMSNWHDRLYYIEHCYFGDLPEIMRMGYLMSIAMKYIPNFKKSFVMIGYGTR